MTALYRKPIETVSAARIIGLGVVGFTTLAVLSLLWWTFSPILGRAYAALRLIETISLWRFTGWGRYFTGMPAGRPFAFVSIYQSSVGFGLVAALLTALIGYLAWRKRSRDHIDALITLPSKGFTKGEIAGRFMPAGRLVRMPASDEVMIPSPPVGPNRFGEIRDLLDVPAVETVLEDIPWHLAATLFLTIDALAPITDRKARETVLKAARTAADLQIADPQAELPATLRPTLYGHLLVSITDHTGREAAVLKQVHEVLQKKPNLASAVSALASAALTEGRLCFPDYAWLRHIDPKLQSAITAY
ncbi:hypothetical protein [Methylobacterium indicum]|uniref:RDD domain-containing protein n=1 Tax=Methylobacterium indicum TaxID=1775910 RepID=A0ABR5H2T2_9HYPH|nr:hypothetical protein [Methylobacterium indicum]KMO13255.1 hypothetical protein QR78_25540 [Methylobacterium indicum]KMO17754.1 hypothetical protein QR79_21325 [Methylobacterium indicum]